MNIAVAGLTHETNTFAPEPTRLADFGARQGGGIPVGADVLDRVEAQSSLQGFCAAARAAGHTLDPIVHAYAPPGGTIVRSDFETLSDMVLAGLCREPRPQAVFLELHGAMVAEGVPDADAELVRRVRALVGHEVPIVAALDLHGNVGAELVNIADGLVAYRSYPHVDMRETGERAFNLLQPLLHGEPTYARAFADLPYLMPISLQSTLKEPCRALYAMLDRIEAESPAPLTLSIMTGFPLADVPQCRPSVFGYGRDANILAEVVARIRATMLEIEPQFMVDLPTARQAVAMALASPSGPVVLADVQDNAGGGATSDTVWILHALLEAGAPDAIVGMIYDPEAAAAAHAAGVGAALDLALGGKRMPRHSPLRARFTVEAVRAGPFELRGPMLAGARMDLGRMARLRVGSIDVVVCSRRAQCLDREYFRVMGLVPEDHQIIVVKSTNHYRADFASMASRIIEFAAPGACAMDPSQLHFQRLAPGTRLFGAGPTFNPGQHAEPL